MDYFANRFFKICKSEFSQYGFKRKSNFYIRLKNDIVQQFNLMRLMSGRECRIYFAFVPIYCPIKTRTKQKIPMCRDYTLRILDGSRVGYPDEWPYERTEESMDNCIDSIIEYMKNNLILFFEKTDNCETALAEACRLDIEENNFLDKSISKAYMALHCGNYDFAIQALKHLIEKGWAPNYIRRYHNGEFDDERLSEAIEELNSYKSLLGMIENKDFKGLEKLMQENAEKNLSELKYLTRV